MQLSCQQREPKPSDNPAFFPSPGLWFVSSDLKERTPGSPLATRGEQAPPSARVWGHMNLVPLGRPSSVFPICIFWPDGDPSEMAAVTCWFLVGQRTHLVGCMWIVDPASIWCTLPGILQPLNGTTPPFSEPVHDSCIPFIPKNGSVPKPGGL